MQSGCALPAQAALGARHRDACSRDRLPGLAVRRPVRRRRSTLLVVRLPALLDQLGAWLSQSPVGAKIVDAVQAAYRRIARRAGHRRPGRRARANLLLNCLLLLVGALFFAADPDIYSRGAAAAGPARQAPRHRRRARRCRRSTLRLWLRAQLILMTTMGVAGRPRAVAAGRAVVGRARAACRAQRVRPLYRPDRGDAARARPRRDRRHRRR